MVVKVNFKRVSRHQSSIGICDIHQSPVLMVGSIFCTKGFCGSVYLDPLAHLQECLKNKVLKTYFLDFAKSY